MTALNNRIKFHFRYWSGQTIEVTVRVTANLRGNFYFSICPLSYPGEVETEECFQRYPVRLADGSSRYHLESSANGDYTMLVTLPEGLRCDHCVFRWHWIAGNNWGGPCEDGKSYRVGCGRQETFRSCSDIAIF